MGRGLYGQSEGNERRSPQEAFEEILHDNQLCEGDWLKRMIAQAKGNDFKTLNWIYEQMISTFVQGGVAKDSAKKRADSCLAQAMNHALRKR